MSAPRPFARGARAARRLAVALLLLPAAARAQEPPTPPVRDTTAVAPDTVPADPFAADSAAAPADTLPPPPRVMPRLAAGVGPTFAAGVWVWDRAALRASTAFTLADLLDQIPGVTPVRSGFTGMPETVSALGMAGGRLEISLDGFILDPLDGASLDLARLPLVHLDEVRVERGLDVLRVELRTIAPEDRRAYSRIEAGDGDLDASLFRGVFLAPRLLGGVLSAAVERFDTDGAAGRQPATMFHTWGKYAVVGDRWGLEVEALRSTHERGRDAVRPVEGLRTEVVARGRFAPAPWLALEAFGGRGRLEDVLDPAADSLPDIDRTATQAGLRAALHAGTWWGAAGLRWRDLEALPGLEARVEAGARPLRPLLLAADATWADWRGASALAYRLRAAAGPVAGLSALAELTAGSRGVAFPVDSADAPPLLTERTALRVGGQFTWGALHAAAAALAVDADSVAPFGLPFETPVARAYAGGDIRGWELSGSLPLLWRPLRAEGWYTIWTKGPAWIYRPNKSWRAALVYHHLPLPSGNLEFLARVEARYRGSMLVPDEAPEPVPDITTLDFTFQLRIMDVRAFLRWNNITNQLDHYDLPGRTFPGQRVFYGVKWSFWN